MLEFKHLILRAGAVAKPPRTPEAVEEWLIELVKLVDMQIFFGPAAKICDCPGNEGITGIIGLETSHASLHSWDGPPAFIHVDLFSCKLFDPQVVVRHLRQFQPAVVDLLLLDRKGIAHVEYADHFNF